MLVLPYVRGRDPTPPQSWKQGSPENSLATRLNNSTFEKLWASQACPWGFNVEMIRFKSAAPFGLVAPGRLCQFPVKHLGFLCSEVAAPGARICEKHMNVNLGLPKSRNVALFRLTKKGKSPCCRRCKRSRGPNKRCHSPVSGNWNESWELRGPTRLMTN